MRLALAELDRLDRGGWWPAEVSRRSRIPVRTLENITRGVARSCGEDILERLQRLPALALSRR